MVFPGGTTFEPFEGFDLHDGYFIAFGAYAAHEIGGTEECAEMRDGSGVRGEGTEMLVRGERVDLDVACRRADEEMGGGERKSERGDGIGGCTFFSVIVVVVVDRDDSACGSDRCRYCTSSADGFPFVLLWLQLMGGGGVGSRVTANDVSFPE